MKLPVRILLIVLCAAMIAALPFVVSAPNMLADVKMNLMNDDDEYSEGDDDGPEIDFGRLFFSSAMAEGEDELEEETLDEGEFSSHPEWALPLDFTPGRKPDAEKYTEDSYEDESISVRIEKIQFDENTTITAAYVRIADASQFRTGVVNPENVATNRTNTVPYLAKMYNAVVAINGDNYVDKPKLTTFEYRMGAKVRSKANKTKDILIIDDQGDFHFYIQSKGLEKAPEELKASGRSLVNAFTFGPALIQDGQLLELDDNYKYNPHGREPRTAIGQTGPLSYVLVVVSAKDRSGSGGLSHGKLAEEMLKMGCINAYNLDGGNSSEMVFGEQIIKGMPTGGERPLSDIIYFATSVPEN